MHFIQRIINALFGTAYGCRKIDRDTYPVDIVEADGYLDYVKFDQPEIQCGEIPVVYKCNHMPLSREYAGEHLLQPKTPIAYDLNDGVIHIHKARVLENSEHMFALTGNMIRPGDKVVVVPHGKTLEEFLAEYIHADREVCGHPV